MSLAQKFEKYAKADADERYETTEQMMKAAFYAGAEAGLQQCAQTGLIDFTEIADFRSHK